MAPAKKPDATKQKARSLSARPAKTAKHAKGVQGAKDIKGGRLLPGGPVPIPYPTSVQSG